MPHVLVSPSPFFFLLQTWTGRSLKYSMCVVSNGMLGASVICSNNKMGHLFGSSLYTKEAETDVQQYTIAKRPIPVRHKLNASPPI